MKLTTLLLLALLPLAAQTTESQLRTLLQKKTGVVTLPAGVIEISREIALPADAHDLEIKGTPETILKTAATFRGRALISLTAGKNIRIHDLALDGNRDAFPGPVAPPPAAAMLSRVVPDNGILAENVAGLEIYALHATGFIGFPILINAGSGVHIHDLEVTDSGSLDPAKHNNGTGGIALEEGVADFDITHVLIAKVRGNGIWIRSVDNAAVTKGHIADSEFGVVARAAIEMNHAANVTIENNTVQQIGFPGEEAIATGTAIPSGIATSGSVSHAIIRGNTFNQIAGRCLSLDGFSDSEVTTNECSDGLFNGFLIRGTNNRITGNRLTNLNSAKRDQPDSLRIGIYLAGGSTGNTLTSNQISGYGMAQHCIGGPALDANKVSTNSCSDGTSVALLLPAKPRSPAFATKSYPSPQ
jgi:hypothetical protein